MRQSEQKGDLNGWIRELGHGDDIEDHRNLLLYEFNVFSFSFIVCFRREPWRRSELVVRFFGWSI